MGSSAAFASVFVEALCVTIGFPYCLVKRINEIAGQP
jgi:hypothetical protein